MKFGTRLAVYYLTATILSMFIIGVIVFKSIELYGIKTVENQLSEQSKLIMVYIKQVFLFEERSSGTLSQDGAKRIANNLSSGIGLVQIYDNSFKLLCNPIEIDEQSSFEQDDYVKNILQPAFQGKEIFKIKNVVCYFAAPIENKGQKIGVLVIVYKLDLLNEVLGKEMYIIIVGAVAFCVLIIILSIYIARKMVKPIQQLVTITDRYSKRDFSIFEINREDEIGQLSKSINGMGLQLQEYINRQKQFISNVSHEIRTPLTAIKGYSEYLMDEVGGSPDTDKALYHLNSEASRLTRLVNDLLLLSRMDSYQETFILSPTNFSNLIEDTINKMKGKAKGQEIELLSQIEPNIFVNAHSEKLVQVVVNILDNAIKYSNSGGQVKIYLVNENNFAIFSIADQGIGIPKEDLKNVFERFHRASNTKGYAGTGLGLAISKEIVEKHEGLLTIENLAEGGTLVKLTLKIFENIQ